MADLLASTPSDEDLLARFHRGERDALAQLAERYELPLLGLARALTGRRDDLALDVVQEAWLRVIKYGCNFDRRSSFRTWIYRIVINRCHDLRQKNQPLSPAAAATPPPPSLDPPHAHTAAELNGRLRIAVEDLAHGQQLVVLLCYHRGLTHEQVADILGVPLGTVKSRLHAALSSLRTSLAAEEPS
jgi:RNA polymerase sigma-70 factor (ECF subfamily)